MCIKRSQINYSDCLPILMLLYIMLAYIMLFAALSNAFCFYNASFRQIFENALSWVIET